MRTVEEYMSLPYKMEIQPDPYSGGYVLCFPELPGCITQGDTIEELMFMAEDAKRCWLEAAIEDGVEIREPEILEEYSGKFKIRMPKDLHKHLANKAKSEGVSMNQYCVHLLSKNAYKK